jgi:hypothetical protein
MPAFKNNPKYQKAAETMPVKVAVFVICKLYAFIIAGYCLIPFATLRFYRWWPIYKEFYFFGHIVILPMTLVWKPIVLKALYTFFPLDKEPVQAANGEKAPLNEPKSNQHEKSN